MPVFPSTATTAHALPRAPPVRIPRRARGTVWGVLDGAREEGRAQGRRNVVWTQCSRGALRTLVDAYSMCGLGVFVATDGTLYQGRCSRLYTRPPTSPLRNRTRGHLRGTARRAGMTHMHMKPETRMRATNGHQPMLLFLGIRLGLDGVNPMLYTFPQPPAFLHSRSAYVTPGHKRSHSWGAAKTPPLPSWANDANTYFHSTSHTLLQIHSRFNGDTPSPIFHLDLAPLSLTPQGLVSANPHQSARLTAAAFREPTFHRRSPHSASYTRGSPSSPSTSSCPRGAASNMKYCLDFQVSALTTSSRSHLS
ncbi:hypothetical protein FB451DRAFT_1400815 [Mycena latifolia]|nr:hypothetical protein FB451DRAFT_1400815 [Mycena latifolia]